MKGAASSQSMSKLHSKIAEVFERVLRVYEKRLDVADQIDVNDIEDEMIQQLFNDGIIPQPAMLTAITTFLKQNQVTFDDEQVAKVSELEQRLAERRQNRKNVVQLSSLKAVEG